VRQSLDCLLGIAPRDAGLGVLSGRVASATAAWAILFDRSAVARKRPNSRELANQLQERLPEALFEKLSGSLSIDTVVLGGPVPSYLASAAIGLAGLSQ
jgi:hypothetical protein